MCLVFCLHVCLYPRCACYLWRSKRALDALELEWQTAGNCHVGAGNQVLLESSQCS